ncbi:MAG TPA: hypothetical protein VL793_07095, partial [Patescibacteria group bacterium]|nr:hypothetical protein [Patescibacteria group bacterium]
IAANLINVGGVVNPGSPFGNLATSAGKSYQQTAGATLSVSLGGSSGSSLAAIGGNATLNGQLQINLVNGFVPQSGQVFEVLSCTLLAGKFSTLSGSPLAGQVWIPRYSSTNVTLLVAGQAVLNKPSFSGPSPSLAIPTTAGVVYTVEATSELNPANWQVIDSWTGDGTIKNVSDTVASTQRFYRVLLQ